MGLFGSRNRNIFRDRAKERRKRMVFGSGAVLAVFAVLAFVTMWEGSDLAEQVRPVHESSPSEVVDMSPTAEDEQLQKVAVVPEPKPKRKVSVRESRIKSGQTAAALLGEYLSPAQIHNLDRQSRKVYPLSRMRAGNPYRIVSRAGQLERFEYEISGEEMLVVASGGSGFDIVREPIQYDIERDVVNGTIVSSLFGAVAEAGEKAALGVMLSEIFAWDVDFIRDIRKNDRFVAVVEKRYRDGEFAGYGKVVAAEFVNQGNSFKGFLFPDANGNETYFDENGKSLRKAFLKAPLQFSRISSGFNLRRLHPILKTRRPHPAIDYAAPRGTPIKAVGDGVVIRKAWGRGAGNYIKIRHNSVYETTYMHMKGFARGMRKGKRVVQGQTIGYVGSTGMSTGPHLDFRMKKNGTYVNPRRIKSPSCSPVPKDKMQDFLAYIRPLMAELGSKSMHADASVVAER